MTIREYILEKVQPFGNISEGALLDMGLDLDEWYSVDNAKDVGIALVGFIEEKVLAPKVTSVNESGFSISWDYSNLGKYYLWLCNKWGVTPNKEVLSLAGISMIKDVSNYW